MYYCLHFYLCYTSCFSSYILFIFQNCSFYYYFFIHIKSYFVDLNFFLLVLMFFQLSSYDIFYALFKLALFTVPLFDNRYTWMIYIMIFLQINPCYIVKNNTFIFLYKYILIILWFSLSDIFKYFLYLPTIQIFLPYFYNTIIYYLILIAYTIIFIFLEF